MRITLFIFTALLAAIQAQNLESENKFLREVLKEKEKQILEQQILIRSLQAQLAEKPNAKPENVHKGWRKFTQRINALEARIAKLEKKSIPDNSNYLTYGITTRSADFYKKIGNKVSTQLPPGSKFALLTGKMTCNDGNYYVIVEIWPDGYAKKPQTGYLKLFDTDLLDKMQLDWRNIQEYEETLRTYYRSSFSSMYSSETCTLKPQGKFYIYCDEIYYDVRYVPYGGTEKNELAKPSEMSIKDNLRLVKRKKKILKK